jgi:hypothetical protein
MSSWSEKTFEEKMTPYIDQIYKQFFGERLKEIKRNNRDNSTEKLMFMDINLAIDTHLTFSNGSILTFQEKTRKNNYLKFNDFTFEYYNDPSTKDEGEWFKLAAQIYFYGYANESETGYERYYILSVPKLRTKLLQNYTIKEMEEKFLRANRPPAKANFFAIPFSILENLDGVLMYKSKELTGAIR